MYVITNGIYYCKFSKTGKILKTDNKKFAYKFNSEEFANSVLNNAPEKLRGYYIIDNKSMNNADDKNIKQTNHQNNIKRKSFSQSIRKEVYKKSEGHCKLCGNFVSYEDFTIDHIIPLAKGGTNDINNLQCACKVCNNIKTDILPNEFMDKITEMIVYNMNEKYNKEIGRKIFKMIITANLHRIFKRSKEIHIEQI